MISISPSTLASTVSLFRPEYLSTLWIDLVCQSVQYIHLSCCSEEQQKKKSFPVAHLATQTQDAYKKHTSVAQGSKRRKAFLMPLFRIKGDYSLHPTGFRQASFISSTEKFKNILLSTLVYPDYCFPVPKFHCPNSSTLQGEQWQQENLTCVRAKGCDTWLTNTCRSFPLRSQLSMRSRCASTQ